jgi:hypothetical protein
MRSGAILCQDGGRGFGLLRHLIGPSAYQNTASDGPEAGFAELIRFCFPSV